MKRNKTLIFFPSNNKVYDTRGVAQLINLRLSVKGWHLFKTLIPGTAFFEPL